MAKSRLEKNQRITAENWKVLQKKKKRTFFFDEALETVKLELGRVGYQVVTAPMEADVFIGGNLETFTHCISTDSDLLAHLVPIVLVPQIFGNRMILSEYRLEDILGFLNMPVCCLQALCIVNGNDYATREHGCGWATNTKVF
jgi:hypothetical protein